MRLILFDIDGTLIETAGAGRRAMDSAIEEILGISRSLSQIRLDGKTDHLILKEVIRQFDLTVSPYESTADRVFDRYVEFLITELEAGKKEFRVLPGVVEALENLSSRKDVVLGLATGNTENGARVKLEAGNLNGYFVSGGFGSDSEDRTQLIQIGITRATQANGGYHPDRTIVVGDTPLDIVHGKAAGTDVVAVSSGSYSAEELMAYGPDLLLRSLDPPEPLIDFVVRN